MEKVTHNSMLCEHPSMPAQKVGRYEHKMVLLCQIKAVHMSQVFLPCTCTINCRGNGARTQLTALTVPNNATAGELIAPAGPYLYRNN